MNIQNLINHITKSSTYNDGLKYIKSKLSKKKSNTINNTRVTTTPTHPPKLYTYNIEAKEYTIPIKGSIIDRKYQVVN